ncbi:hypothetical protein A3D80_00655 [Candidatus Roizmanbacteria bacterium RIFCSPHIGHO2_02_FULL_40_13b]|uniref:D-isomer specific 2-hydroxyacid dehydrogenase NAD-binding domain-containing protein n=1 Tax=Candidatus Roizmanbacteria bacterium RIFCSPHIGHO2_01_FULL_39_24 TaxID=1802032 RepID=A0A1F7GKD1_9BACT|nr:MAG: hypothetical protein A2799_02620 [Candidatus Roizmanbacteria bacterium RIFCSPHIGHO2_01_FULL_39_24]OGK27457.1 MAG: hypothetical protein A3D80_00655 [Candidatus Roizmanbacteria bacterium RIFCSPHIGHO2_02_FULL_40_13b]OGK50014.1 MAG: hypothetical protein A3A56_00955 [Candidatus Roizmanbacteria bacterium RIFCSPLOWO2_01_FULL_40_32]OGK56529.1 MAG: hypothetical protein A3H83_03945 [Candidatus Roizmanbacteria bacterium RIFCSPLOWO2_02_FULL_39_8]
MKVIFAAPKTNFPPQLLEKLVRYAEYQFFEENPIDIRNIKELKEPGDKILIPFPEPMAWKFPNEYIKEIPDLKAICLSTTAFSWVDGELARSLNIPLTYVPNVPNGVAEGAIFAMLALAKRWATSFKNKSFEFKPSNFLLEIQGKTIGIIGLGKIGSRIAQIGEGMGGEIVYWSKHTRNNKYKYLELEELMKTADFIFPAASVTPETEKFITKELLDMMKPTASLIAIVNTKIIDIEYVLEKAQKGEIFGLAIQSGTTTVEDYEGNVFVTQENNWYTKETVETKMTTLINTIISVIEDKPINVVN